MHLPFLILSACAPRTTAESDSDTDDTAPSSEYTPVTRCVPDGPVEISDLHVDCEDGRFTARVRFVGCPREAGVVVVGGDPLRGEDHRPFYSGAWDEVVWMGRRPEGTLPLRLETESRHWRPGESTSFACDELAPPSPDTTDLTLAVWLTDLREDVTVCRAWGSDTARLLSGDLDAALMSTTNGGKPRAGSPPPRGWSSCTETSTPTVGTTTGHTGHSGARGT